MRAPPIVPSLLVALAALLACAPVRAGQPLVTDDAAVLDAGHCQLEAWMVFADGGQAPSAAPACSPVENLELGFGAASVSKSGDRWSLMVVQVKGVLVPRGDGAWSFGALAGAVRDTGAPRGSSAFQSGYAKALASWYPGDDIEIDINLGAAYTHGLGSYALGGVALQASVTDRLQALAEVYRDEPGRGKAQAGFRYALVPDRVEAYLSYGQRLGSGPREWFAVAGFRVEVDLLAR